jgi:hypothetical protein
MGKSFEELFLNLGEEVYFSIKECYEKNYMNTVLILLYSYIDQMAYLNMDEKDKLGVEKEFQEKDDFKRWVDEFMLSNPKCKLACTSSDIYSARCGIIHTRTPFSKDVKKDKAEMLLYTFKKVKKESLDRLRRFAGVEYISIQIDELVEVFFYGLAVFYEHINSNPKKREVAYKRLKRMLVKTTREETTRLNTLHL